MTALLLSLFFSLSSFGMNPWMQVEADRSSLLYTEGEPARFTLRLQAWPTDPLYSVSVFAEQVGEGAPIPLPIAAGRAFFTSPPLAPGEPIFRFYALLTGPNGFEEIVDDRSWQLTVIPEAL